MFLSQPHKVGYNSCSGNLVTSSFIVGQDPSNLEQFSTSLVSTTSYIAHISVTDDSLHGAWTVMIQSEGSYNIQVFGSSEQSFSEDFFTIDSSSPSRFRELDGKPLQG